MSDTSTVKQVGEFTNHDPNASPADSYEKYGEWRRECPVVHSEAHGGFYMYTRYNDIRAAARDWKTYSSVGDA